MAQPQHNNSSAFFGNRYSYINVQTAIQEIANRLYDPTMVFWTQAELELYLAEAIRTWNAMASYWRGDFTFHSSQGVTWYDLTNEATMPNTLREQAMLDTDLYDIIEYHLLEPAAGVNPWTGSMQFTADDLVNAVQRRRDEILNVCGCTQTVRTIGASAGRTILPDTVIDIRRVAYLPGASSGQPISVMWPEDAWAEQSFNVNYTNLPAGIPLTYLISTQPPLSFDTDRPPAWAGNYELLTVEAGPLLSSTSPQPLSIPDDWSHVLKWGAMADLFNKESNAKDELRAKYCEQRYKMGLQLLTGSAAVLALRIGNIALQIDSVKAADLYQTGWQAQSQGTPSSVYHSGLNLLALAPSPNAGPYSGTLTVLANAPMFGALADKLQVSREDLDVVIDYAQHLAALKMGGEEFLSTMPLLERFLKQAAVYGLKLSEIAEYTSAIYGLSAREEQMNPRMQTVSMGDSQ